MEVTKQGIKVLGTCLVLHSCIKRGRERLIQVWEWLSPSPHNCLSLNWYKAKTLPHSWVLHSSLQRNGEQCQDKNDPWFWQPVIQNFFKKGGLRSAGVLRQNMHKPHWCTTSQQVHSLQFLLVLAIIYIQKSLGVMAYIQKGLDVRATSCFCHPVIWYHILHLRMPSLHTARNSVFLT